MKKLIIIATLIIGVGVGVYQKPNGLKVYVKGNTELVAEPNAILYKSGDVIRFEDIDGVFYNAIVVEPVVIEPDETVPPAPAQTLPL